MHAYNPVAGLFLARPTRTSRGKVGTTKLRPLGAGGIIMNSKDHGKERALLDSHTALVHTTMGGLMAVGRVIRARLPNAPMPTMRAALQALDVYNLASGLSTHGVRRCQAKCHGAAWSRKRYEKYYCICAWMALAS